MNSLGTADLEFCKRLGQWSVEHRGTGISDATAIELTGVVDGEERTRALIDAIGLLFTALKEVEAQRGGKSSA